MQENAEGFVPGNFLPKFRGFRVWGVARVREAHGSVSYQGSSTKGIQYKLILTITCMSILSIRIMIISTIDVTLTSNTIIPRALKGRMP